MSKNTEPVSRSPRKMALRACLLQTYQCSPPPKFLPCSTQPIIIWSLPMETSLFQFAHDSPNLKMESPTSQGCSRRPGYQAGHPVLLSTPFLSLSGSDWLSLAISGLLSVSRTRRPNSFSPRAFALALPPLPVYHTNLVSN